VTEKGPVQRGTAERAEIEKGTPRRVNVKMLMMDLAWATITLKREYEGEKKEGGRPSLSQEGEKCSS